jgi:threonyl-tRNA synthetase
VQEAISHAKRVNVECILLYPFAHLSNKLAEPDKAYRLLIHIEERLSKLWRGRLLRAPFGWYKAFRLNCVGHPLCELSREYRGGTLHVSRGSETIPLEEATSRGYLPNLGRGRWLREAEEVMARFGLSPLTGLGLDIVGGLVIHIMNGRLPPEAPLISLPYTESIPRSLGVLGACLDAIERGGGNEAIIYTNSGGDYYISSRKNIIDRVASLLPGFNRAIRSIEVTSSSSAGGESVRLVIPWYGYAEGALYYYASKGGRSSVIAASMEASDVRVYCVGPLTELARSLVDYAVSRAQGGVTPYLPFWANPVHVAFIPVKEEHASYVEAIAYEAARLGLRVYIDLPPGSLGSRIRRAGRLWSLYVVVAGGKEVEGGTLSVRRRVEGDQVVMSVGEFLEELAQKASTPPTPLAPAASPPLRGL